MMAYQWWHCDWGTRETRERRHSKRGKDGALVVKKGTKAWSVDDIAGEAERRPGHAPHVIDPHPLRILHGMTPSDAAKKAREWSKDIQTEVVSKSGEKRKRGLRSDAPIMAAGVISLPAEMIEDWDAYKAVALEYLMEKHGPRLLSVIEHLDEEHPHLHYYAVPLTGEPFDAVHAGYAARRAAEKAGEKAGDVLKAFKAAMSAEQVAFHERVASRFGLMKDGPRRLRLDRAEYKARKAEEAAQIADKRAERARDKADKEQARQKALQTAGARLGAGVVGMLKWAAALVGVEIKTTSEKEAEMKAQGRKADGVVRAAQEATKMAQETAQEAAQAARAAGMREGYSEAEAQALAVVKAERRKAEIERRRADEEKAAREVIEKENAELTAQLAALKPRGDRSIFSMR
jgi:hypothetical protein